MPPPPAPLTRLPVLLRLAPVVALVFVAVVVGARVARTDLQGYGMGAEYAEHDVRVGLLLLQRGSGAGPLDRLFQADLSYPPLLHVITNAAAPLTGQSFVGIALFGVLWVALLGLGVGMAAQGWSGDPRAGPLAATLVILMPVVSALATRYYFDLPSAALAWLGAGALAMAARRRPRTLLVLAGIAWAACCLVKWSGLPFGAIVLASAVRDRASLRRFAGAIGIGLAILGLFLATTPGGSFSTMAEGLLPSEDIEEPPERSFLPAPYGAAVARPLRQLELLTPRFVAWFPLSLLCAVLSIGVAIVLTPLVIRALRSGSGARWPVAVVLGGGVLFNALWLHVQDERFLIGFMPVLPGAAAIGLLSLSARARRGWLAALVATQALVTLDFHFAAERPWNRAVELLFVPYRSIHVTARGLGLASSEAGIGWRRADEQEDQRAPYREHLWAALRADGAREVGVAPGAALIGQRGDEPWLRWRTKLEELQTGEEPFQVRSVRPEDAPPALLLARVPHPGQRPDMPWFPGGDWVQDRAVTDDGPDGGAEVALYRFVPRPRRAPAEVDCAAGADALDVQIVHAPGVEARCADQPTRCTADYARFLTLPEVRAHARPLADCAGTVQELFRARAGRRSLWTTVPLPEGRATGEVLLDELGMDWLFDPLALDARPLQVLQTGERLARSFTGATYRERTLLLRDPIVGELSALHLLPEHGDGPFPTVLALPGHVEDAAQHRDQRGGQLFPEHGYGLLILTMRAWEQPADHEVTRDLMCQGYSLLALHAYEALVAFKYLRASPLACNQRLGLVGHSGGSLVGNVLAWLDADPAVAHVTDNHSMFHNVDPNDEGEWNLDCETSEVLYRYGDEINALDRAPRPILRVPYAYGDCDGCGEPSPTDRSVERWLFPFFDAHLKD